MHKELPSLLVNRGFNVKVCLKILSGAREVGLIYSLLLQQKS